MKKFILKIINKYFLLKLIYNKYNRNKQRKISKKKSKLFLNNYKYNLNKKIWLIYDFKSSPISIGDVMHLILIARYMAFKFHEVQICFIIEELRKEYYSEKSEYLDEKIFSNFFENLEDIINLLKFDNISLTKKNWIQFKNLINTKDFFKLNYIYDYDKIINRHPNYTTYFIDLNFLLFYDNKNIHHILFNKKQKNFKKIKISNFKLTKFVTFHCRYTIEGDIRNLTKKEFLYLSKFLREKFIDHDILIVSDKIGCDYFKEISSELNFKIYFSKDFTNSYVEDGYLILLSDFYFQFKGGGIHPFAEFSMIDFYIHKWAPSNETFHSKNKSLFFHNEYQVSVEVNDIMQIFKHIKIR